MRIFIQQADSYVGRALLNGLRKEPRKEPLADDAAAVVDAEEGGASPGGTFKRDKDICYHRVFGSLLDVRRKEVKVGEFFEE